MRVTEIIKEDTTDITPAVVMQCWLKVFPNSDATTNKQYGNNHIVRLFLTKDANECSNRIRDNDPFRYIVIITDGAVKEHSLSLLVKPTIPHMAYSSVKLRLKTIKNANEAKLLARFQEVRKFIFDNAQNLKNVQFDINTK